MVGPPHMIEFLKLRACSVKIKGRHTLKWGTCSYSNTEQQYIVVARQRTSIGFKLVVCGDTRAGGLVAPLPCTPYLGKLTILFGCSLLLALLHLMALTYHRARWPKVTPTHTLPHPPTPLMIRHTLNTQSYIQELYMHLNKHGFTVLDWSFIH